ncbi:MAG: DEAD/DEAH box helicase family protein [Desulfotignum sp.]|nr:DEAD/DEAH box helicase family protein [Desulfotignum sp.]
MTLSPRETADFTTRQWPLTFRTSAGGPDDSPVSILHDFYVPVLRMSVAYDRVAGYFRSSSLAGASQGFSAFTRSGGAMRLVVGADLEAHDVQAILDGDAQRLAGRLNQALGEPASWPEDVCRGVTLLAWMVAHGFLDVRVAFRVHGETGKPLPFTDTSDGYVHKKWAIFTDANQHHIYINGSLNESITALVHNAESIDVHGDWLSDRDQARVTQAKDDFQRIWQNRSPYLRVLTLPEAVKENLVKIAENLQVPKEIDGTTDMAAPVDPPSAMELLQFSLIKHGPNLPGGRYVGMETAPVTPWPHQEMVARRLIDTWPYSYLLCDEVGLGKTIEAGLAIRSLKLSGRVKRVLIAAPASLTRQWQREMADKFFMDFARAAGGVQDTHHHLFPCEISVPSSGLFGPDQIIVSTGLMWRQQRQQELATAQPFDIVLLDEAHYARRKNPGANKDSRRTAPDYGNLYKLMRDQVRPRTQSLWMATATPMQLDWIEAFDLLRLTLRTGAYQRDPSLTWTYYQALGELVQGRDIDPARWDLFRSTIQSLDYHDPFYRQYLTQCVIDARMQTGVRLWLEHDRIPAGMDRQYIRKLIFAASPLSRVMLRHTRPLLEIYRDRGRLGAGLARRIILPVPLIRFTSREQQVYDELEAYCNGLTTQITRHVKSRAARTSLGFYLSFLRLRFASSVFAITETFRRRLDRVTRTLNYQMDLPLDDEFLDMDGMDWEDEEDDRFIKTLLKNRTQADLEWEQARLSRLMDTCRQLTGTPSKMQALLEILEKRRTPAGRMKQTVVFTRFYDTLSDIVARLRKVDRSILLGTYSGKGGQYVNPDTRQLKTVHREAIKHRFLRGDIDLLICTDAAAEGLNLQTADLLINFDLPWNPMKVEQRIGRIDRIGQTHETIQVLNLCYVNSAEEIVYDRLLRRLAQAAGVVGTQQVSMLPVYEEDFRKLATGEIKEEQLEKLARKRIKRQKELTQSMEIPPKDLYEIYDRLNSQYALTASPVGLDAFWQAVAGSRYLKDLGCQTLDAEADRMVCLSGIDKIIDGTFMTFSRKVYEEHPREENRTLAFGTYGSPVFEAVVDAVTAHDLPACIRKLTAGSGDGACEITAFAVACTEPVGTTGKTTGSATHGVPGHAPDVTSDDTSGGPTRIRLVTAWQDLKDLQICEHARITDQDLEQAQQALETLLYREYSPIAAVKRLEQQNLDAAAAQETLNLLSAHALIKPIGTNETDNFHQVTNERSRLLKERDQLTIPNLPVPALQKIAPDLLFSIRVPRLGDTMTWTAPIFVVTGAVDAAVRLADAMKAKRSELTVGAVRSRIQRAITEKK